MARAKGQAAGDQSISQEDIEALLAQAAEDDSVPDRDPLLDQREQAGGAPFAAAAEPWGAEIIAEVPSSEPSLAGAEAGGNWEPVDAGFAVSGEPARVSPVQFASLRADPVPSGAAGIDLLLDVSLQVTAELGRTDLNIRQILALGPGAVIELERLAGEPVDILVNGTLIARGEVVVVDEKFGVRVTEVVPPAKRVMSLG